MAWPPQPHLAFDVKGGNAMCVLLSHDLVVVTTDAGLAWYQLSTGAFVATVGNKGDGPLQFRYGDQVSVCTTCRDTVLVAEEDNNRLQVMVMCWCCAWGAYCGCLSACLIVGCESIFEREFESVPVEHPWCCPFRAATVGWVFMLTLTGS